MRLRQAREYSYDQNRLSPSWTRCRWQRSAEPLARHQKVWPGHYQMSTSRLAPSDRNVREAVKHARIDNDLVCGIEPCAGSPHNPIIVKTDHV
jgi:hypothetical protein